MDAKTARDTIIKPKLIATFGANLAGLLLIKAINAGMSSSNEADKLRLGVESICTDPKVIALWGAAQAARQKEEWCKLA
jgi:hypothetical protein